MASLVGASFCSSFLCGICQQLSQRLSQRNFSHTCALFRHARAHTSFRAYNFLRSLRMLLNSTRNMMQRQNVAQLQIYQSRQKHTRRHTDEDRIYIGKLIILPVFCRWKKAQSINTYVLFIADAIKRRARTDVEERSGISYVHFQWD